MTNISVGNARINFRNTEPKSTNNTNNVSSENVKLRGITWNDNVNRIDDLIRDRNNVTKRDNGVIPSGNELPELFADDTQYNNDLPDMQGYSNQDYNNYQNNNNYQDYSNNQDYGYGQSQPQTQQSSDEGAMSTGIGMAIGAVGGGILGKKYGMTKWGVAIGTAIGGFIGNKIGK